MRQPSDTRSPTAMDGGVEGLKRFPDPASGIGEGSPAGEDDAGRGVAGGKRRPLSAFEGVIDGAIKLRGTATFLAPDHALRHAFGPTLSGKRLKRVLTNTRPVLRASGWRPSFLLRP